jgi:NitT/TauT family transport system substrate-binding protein
MSPRPTAHDRIRLLMLVLCMICVIALAGCGSMTTGQTDASPKTAVRLQLDWIHTIEYSSFYTAQDQGAYAAANLDVTIETLDQKLPVDAVDAVAAGKAQFGVTSADNLLFARAAGKPLVAIATIYQRSPVVFISLAKNKIIRPQDLVGKTVVLDLEGSTAIVYWALLSSQGIDATQVNTQPRSDYGNDSLLQGKADVIDAFINNQPIQLAQQGIQINAILPSEYGIDLYANVIFTSEELIATQPEVVAAFVKATVSGMQSAVNNPDAAAARAVARDPQLNLKSETESMQRALPLMNPAGSKPGMMTDESWRVTEQILRDQGLLAQGVDTQKAYTLTFLERAYAK